MVNGKKLIVVLPAYNAAKTLKKTYDAIPHERVDEVLLIDDCSTDDTVKISRELGITTLIHDQNKGYGANQKTCYREAMNRGADIVIMLHPDYQYNPRLITAMSSLITEGIYDTVIASRIIGTGALKGGMPLYKYIGNRILTLAENLMTGQKLSEYHTGYRAFSREVLMSIPLLENSDDFVFDNQMLLQTLYFGFSVAEISCPTVYNKESSSISFLRSIVYGLGVLRTGLQYRLSQLGIIQSSIFDKGARKLVRDATSHSSEQ